jgi:hypothetical protein
MATQDAGNVNITGGTFGAGTAPTDSGVILTENSTLDGGTFSGFNGGGGGGGSTPEETAYQSWLASNTGVNQYSGAGDRNGQWAYNSTEYASQAEAQAAEDAANLTISGGDITNTTTDEYGFVSYEFSAIESAGSLSFEVEDAPNSDTWISNAWSELTDAALRSVFTVNTSAGRRFRIKSTIGSVSVYKIVQG